MAYRDAFEKVWLKLHGWLSGLIAMLPNIAAAIVVLVVSALVARGLSALCFRLLSRLHVQEVAARLGARVTHIATLAGGFIFALSILQLEKAVTSLLAGVGIVGFALGFAFQDLAANFVSGVALSLRNRYPFQIGDLIETNGFLGVAEQVHLRNTVVRTLDGNAVVLPNRKIYEETLINYSADQYRRIELACGISYAENLREVKRLVLDVASRFEGRIADRPIDFFWTGYGDSAINFQAFLWIPFKSQKDFLEARSELLMRVKEAFDERGITIPFPIRTLDFGIKGGEQLNAMLTPNTPRGSASS